MKVSDLMTQNIVTAQPDWSVGQVIDLILNEDVSNIAIVDSNDRLVGIVTESALLVAAFDPQLRTDPISLHMQRKFVSATPNEPVGQVVEKFLLHRVRHFPVVDDNKLVGIVTRRDLMRAVLGSKTPKKVG